VVARDQHVPVRAVPGRVLQHCAGA
jgi:hypothetical protein